MNRPKRSNDKYWQGTRNFDHIQFETDLEEYIDELEKVEEPKPLDNGTDVTVRSGDKRLNGKIEKSEWDFDQWTYFVNGEWYCQSEVTKLI